MCIWWSVVWMRGIQVPSWRLISSEEPADQNITPHGSGLSSALLGSRCWMWPMAPFQLPSRCAGNLKTQEYFSYVMLLYVSNCWVFCGCEKLKQMRRTWSIHELGWKNLAEHVHKFAVTLWKPGWVKPCNCGPGDVRKAEECWAG